MKTSFPFFSRKSIAIAAGILAIGAAGTVSLTGRANKAPVAAAMPASVSVASVLEKPVTEWDDFSGRVEAIERVEIRPRAL